ncbi:hypothetical protein SAMN05216233_13139 [Desulfoluna spongiiphila]|uniref:Uncharacterized protein n=1 Tax=Desulfoluna spongiiphila TaxID=419481 RepID=A0A1G5JIK1_9BACT|nr:hypothetical protein SAMN05216233_13139 [Desulfoluna spongiiphila]
MSKPRIEVDAIRNALVELGLLFSAEALPGLLSESVKKEMPSHELLGRLLAVKPIKEKNAGSAGRCGCPAFLLAIRWEISILYSSRASRRHESKPWPQVHISNRVKRF